MMVRDAAAPVSMLRVPSLVNEVAESLSVPQALITPAAWLTSDVPAPARVRLAPLISRVPVLLTFPVSVLPPLPALTWTVPALVKVEPLATVRLLALPLPVYDWSTMVPALLAPAARVRVESPLKLLPCTSTVPLGALLLIRVVLPLPPMAVMVVEVVMVLASWSEQPWASTAPLTLPPLTRNVPASQTRAPVAAMVPPRSWVKVDPALPTIRVPPLAMVKVPCC